MLTAEVTDILCLLATSVKVAFGDLRSFRTLDTVTIENLPPNVNGSFS